MEGKLEDYQFVQKKTQISNLKLKNHFYGRKIRRLPIWTEKTQISKL